MSISCLEASQSPPPSRAPCPRAALAPAARGPRPCATTTGPRTVPTHSP